MQNWKKKVAGSFDDAAENYDLHSHVQASAAEKLAGLLTETPAPDVLEIGCGTGALTCRLFEKFPGGAFKITDISPRMLQQSRAQFNHKRTHWTVVDGENLSGLRTFDLIVSNMTFQWFENPAESLERMRRFLKPGGRIFYSVPGPESFKEWRKVLDALNLPAGGFDFSCWPGITEKQDMTINYGNALVFLRSVKAIGAGTARADYRPLNSAQLRAACREFDARFQGRVTWQILYGSLA